MKVNKDKENALNYELLITLLRYEPSTGIFTWINKIGRRINIGDVAGSIDSRGRRIIVIFKKHYLAARLAWLYMTKDWPTTEVDHENRVCNDDKWKNLRLASRSQNTANKHYKRKTKLGLPQGVRKRGNRYSAECMVNKIPYKLGTFDTPSEAHNAYVQFSIKMNKEFSFYRDTPNKSS